MYKKHNVILIGFKNSGKTYFGSRLAKELGCAFIDTDRLIEEDYERKTRSRLSCREIAIGEGEKKFRQLEKKSISSLSTVNNTIISVGGGTIFFHENLTLLRTIGPLVYLEVSKEILKTRTLSQPLPSFFDAAQPEVSFEMIYSMRAPHYEKSCSQKIKLDGKSDFELLEELKAFYGQ